MKDAVDVKPIDPVPCNRFESKDRELETALAASLPEIVPVVVIAPELLTCIKVVEPDTKEMFPLLSYCIILVRPDAD